MKKFSTPLCLILLSPLSVFAQQVPTDQESALAVEQYAELLRQTKAKDVHLGICLDRYSKSNPSDETIRSCLFKEKEIEHILVEGRYLGLESPEVVGRYHIDRNFIENAPSTNGDINELIALLPGVQVSESALDVDNLQEIKAQDISISGAKAWQTGFFIDGMNYNSRQDPAAAGRAVSDADDVQGGVQTMNVNSNMVSSIAVYDNNIPAEHGNFSGGVVDVKTIDAFDTEDKTSFSLGYRGTQSSWGNYHTILAEPEPGEAPVEFDDTEPDFKKNNYNVQVSHQFNRNHGLVLSANYLESVISDVSLQQTKNQERTNLNALIKYSYRYGWIDKLDWSFVYAPYENINFLKDTLNSDLTIDGGAIGSTLNLGQDFSWMYFTSKLNFSQSTNSREAPQHYYIWLQAKGKEWGKYADGNDITSTPVSKEGGHGDLDKVQTTISWKTKFALNDFQIGETYHNAHFGTDIQQESIDRDRDEDSYYYNSAIQYSTDPTSPGLNCSGYTLDCVERTFYQSLDQLESTLGEPLDFSNPDHLQAYSDNIATTPQYFQSRLVRPEEHISVSINRYAFFASDSIEWGRINTNLAVRAEYDNFFKNLNLSPRFSMGVDVFDDGSSMAIFGLNRYYDAGLLTYKIREQERPSYTQYRPIRDGYLQGWLDSSAVSDYKYRYTDLATPYDDELVLGWKQSTEHFGNFSIKYVKRKKHDQLSRESDTVKGDDGFYYIQVTNGGYGDSERITFAWDAKFGDHSFWFNTSFTENYTSNDDYDTTADQVPLDELVYYDGKIISKSDLDLINDNFSRPFKASFGWATDWTQSLTTSFTGSYSDSYETAVSTGGYQETGELSWSCPECESTSVLVPVYKKTTVDKRLLINMKLTWKPQIEGTHRIRMTADVSNLFDARTYTVKDGSSGIEVGRQFWLGISYDFN